MENQLFYSVAELSKALHVSYADLADLEKLPDPLPYFTVHGNPEHLYPAAAVSAWAARQCSNQRKK